MEKREKIILAATVVAALYGGLDFFVLSAKKGGPEVSGSQVSSAILSTIASQLAGQGESHSGLELHRIDMAKGKWRQDIFFEASSRVLFEEGETVAKEKSIKEKLESTDFVYSGFLEMMGRKVAIINGTDYAVGDLIEGFMLEEIGLHSITISLDGYMFKVEAVPTNEI